MPALDERPELPDYLTGVMADYGRLRATAQVNQPLSMVDLVAYWPMAGGRAIFTFENWVDTLIMMDAEWIGVQVAREKSKARPKRP